jgi:hypothetical protein
MASCHRSSNGVFLNFSELSICLGGSFDPSVLITRLTDPGDVIAIHREKFHKLVTALRTAVANEYKLDKEQTSYNDILDAFRLALQFYKRGKI